MPGLIAKLIVRILPKRDLLSDIDEHMASAR